MTDLVWESVAIKQIARGVEPFASIGQGRIALNSEACELIENIYDYEWVNIIQAKSGNRVVKVGLRFTNTRDKNSLRPTRRRYKGELVGGLNINSKQLVKLYFGETKETSVGRFLVEKKDNNTLAIDIQKEL